VRRRELDLTPRPGRELTLGLTAHTLRRDDGSARGVLALFVDLTQASRRADEERRASSLAQLGRMSAGLAHELRNSLAALRGYLTLIERNPDEESITDYLGEIRSESDQLQRVLEDFLSFARPEARLETLSVTELATHAAADPGLGVAVHVDDRTGGGIRLRADRQLLERALRNLLRNAAEAQAEARVDAPIQLRIDGDGEAIRLEIDDLGPGVPPGRLEELFEPFATTRAEGVGLGLPMQREEASVFDELTSQEMQVLALIAEGNTNRSIAETLFLSEGTVRNYVSSILSKLGVSNRAEATAYAIQNHLKDYLG
jgi:signal transduction histidine kinase/DNA-binding CsgD family transcriptional regulator